MRKENAILCGGIIWNDEMEEILCDPEVGELFFEPDLEEPMMIGELAVTNPIGLPNTKALGAFLVENKLVGAIYTQDGLFALLSDTVAEVRPLSQPKLSTGNTITIDCNIVAEFEDADL